MFCIFPQQFHHPPSRAGIEYFFSTYKDLEGKRVQAAGWEKSERAMQIVVDSIERGDRYFLESFAAASDS